MSSYSNRSLVSISGRRALLRRIKIIKHMMVKAAPIIISVGPYWPDPKIIGIGPTRNINPMESFSPVNNAAKINIIIPINIRIKPRKNILMNGECGKKFLSASIVGFLIFL